MDLSQLTEALRHDATWIVFLNVLLQQAGLPVPAVPTLLLAGSLTASPGQLFLVWMAAIAASVAADWVWYRAGRRFGYRVLSGLCRISINPGSCVGQAEARFRRWGLTSLVVAKLIPGFSTVAPPIAGALRIGLPGFLLASALGAALWSGLGLAIGWMLRSEVQAAIVFLNLHTTSMLYLIVAAGVLWICWKLLQKYRFRKLSALLHITIDELLELLGQQSPPLLLDLRGQGLAAQTQAIPGATVADYEGLLEVVNAWPREHPIVTLCACPEDATAIQAAQKLLKAGFTSVRPLKGGYQAWADATLNKDS